MYIALLVDVNLPKEPEVKFAQIANRGESSHRAGVRSIAGRKVSETPIVPFLDQNRGQIPFHPAQSPRNTTQNSLFNAVKRLQPRDIEMTTFDPMR
jgi:hypothetical protein